MQALLHLWMRRMRGQASSLGDARTPKLYPGSSPDQSLGWPLQPLDFGDPRLHLVDFIAIVFMWRTWNQLSTSSRSKDYFAIPDLRASHIQLEKETCLELYFYNWREPHSLTPTSSKSCILSSRRPIRCNGTCPKCFEVCHSLSQTMKNFGGG